MSQKIALVLSSGGARGFIHIGAIEELLSQGYEISSIAGTSIGALIGGMFALGKMEPFKEWVCSLDNRKILSLVDVSLGRDHLVKGHKLMEAFQKIAEDCPIENLPIPYTAVATDLRHGNEIVFRTGSLFEAMRASFSIPSFFSPPKIEDMILVDGAVLNPLPLNRVERTNNDLLLAVNVSAPKDYNIENIRQKNKFMVAKKIIKESTPEKSHVRILNEVSDLMVQQIVRLSIQLNQPDIMLNIPMNRYGSFDYDKVPQIIQKGRIEMRKILKKKDRNAG